MTNLSMLLHPYWANNFLSSLRTLKPSTKHKLLNLNISTVSSWWSSSQRKEKTIRGSKTVNACTIFSNSFPKLIKVAPFNNKGCPVAWSWLGLLGQVLPPFLNYNNKIPYFRPNNGKVRYKVRDLNEFNGRNRNQTYNEFVAERKK